MLKSGLFIEWLWLFNLVNENYNITNTNNKPKQNDRLDSETQALQIKIPPRVTPLTLIDRRRLQVCHLWIGQPQASCKTPEEEDQVDAKVRASELVHHFL